MKHIYLTIFQNMIKQWLRNNTNLNCNLLLQIFCRKLRKLKSRLWPSTTTNYPQILLKLIELKDARTRLKPCSLTSNSKNSKSSTLDPFSTNLVLLKSSTSSAPSSVETNTSCAPSPGTRQTTQSPYPDAKQLTVTLHSNG